jgi:hypothetical protein
VSGTDLARLTTVPIEPFTSVLENQKNRKKRTMIPEDGEGEE